MIASVAGEIADGALTNRRPFRAPHHSASMPALVGGGLRAKPGEVSLILIALIAVPAAAHSTFSPADDLCFTSGAATYKLAPKVSSPDYQDRQDRQRGAKAGCDCQSRAEYRRVRLQGL